MTLNPSSIKALKKDLSDLAAQYTADLVSAGYNDYSAFKDEIKKLVNSAITLGVESSSSRANINHLATRRDLDAMVEALGESVQKLHEKTLKEAR